MFSQMGIRTDTAYQEAKECMEELMDGPGDPLKVPDHFFHELVDMVCEYEARVHHGFPSYHGGSDQTGTR